MDADLPVEFRDAAPRDYEAMLVLNESAVPHVNSISRQLLERLHVQAFRCRIATVGGEVAGFVIALGEDAEYSSLNFAWFRRRYSRFVYVDRVVVDPGARRAGIARRLYRELERAATGRTAMLAAEVNLQPPNPASMAFHEGFGFREVGRQRTEGGTKQVRLMVKELSYG